MAMRVGARAATLLVAVVGAASVCTTSPATSVRPVRAQPVAPFVYAFRVVEFSATATLTYFGTSATIQYRLLKPSDAKTIAYFGPHPSIPGGAFKAAFIAPIVDVAAEATYRSRDPACTNSIDYRPTGNKIVQVYVELPPRVTARRVSASVIRIPLAEPLPGDDAVDVRPWTGPPRPKCGEPHMGSWYQDMRAFAPLTLVAGPRVTLRGSHRERFTDEGMESIDWKLRVVLQRLEYRKIDCARHRGC